LILVEIVVAVVLGGHNTPNAIHISGGTRRRRFLA
jgi:hypothetical protein